MKEPAHGRFLGKMILLLTLLCLLGCAQPRVAAGNDQVIKPTPYRFVYAMAQCAPWDGAAVELVFTDQEMKDSQYQKPYLSITIYHSATELLGQTYQLDNSKVGSAALCPAQGNCRLVKTGRVTIKSLVPDRSIGGEYELEFENGERRQGSFQAVWLNRHILCG